ncbi:ABC transporter permease [Phytohabitans rumicis]|uniref:Transport permease protein n=1 Tax=Phytohabitans rumicis TaxID=1076125 RepID=A0A6V8L520_9ACTN|nr:ABC transporter permease [Phytohabitans rumicis]GFJ91304.1 transport permease protein [Phytohabitans rumicis]
MKFLRDTWLIFQRQMLLVLRNPVWLIIGVLQPLYFLLLFGPLLKDALQVDSAADAYRIFVPGLLVMLAMFGAMFTGFGLIAELRAGVIERSRVTPISRLALMLGRALRDVATLLFQAVLITVLAIPFGLTVRLGDVLLAYLLLGLIGVMMSAVSNALALKLKTEDALAPLMNGVAQPLLLLSGILLPLSGWVATVANFNPFAWAVDASRALFAGDPGNSSVWQALLIIGGLTVAALMWSARSFARGVR